MFSASSILGTNFGVVSAALDGLAMRQKVHADNLANIDTPGYQAKTVDFERQLSAALRSASSQTANPMLADGAGLPSGMADSMTGGMMFDMPGMAGANGAGLGMPVTAMAMPGAAPPGFVRPTFTSQVLPGEGGVNRIQETNQMMSDQVRFRFLSQNVTNRISGLRSVISEMGRA